MSIVNEPTDNWVTGSDPCQTTQGTIASGQNLAAHAPLGQVTATGKFVIWAPAATDGSQVATRLTPFAVDASAADRTTQLIKAGTFNPELVAWPEGTTAAQKLAAFVGTPISLQPPF